MRETIKRFMSQRPECEAIIGYGSGISKQKDQENRKVQVDLIVVVEDIKKWHKENAKMNSTDYSFTGRQFMTKVSKGMLKKGGKICYMTYIPFEGHSFKIGTIEKNDFLDSLTLWDTFYLAGRMQKPIMVVKASKEIKEAISHNREMAVAAASLISEERKIPLTEFYQTIVSLSYMGDTRMKFAENPKKVSNIVMGALDFFEENYGSSELLKKTKGYITNKHTKENIELLPILIRTKIENDENAGEVIKDYLKDKNKTESSVQTIKGIFTSGPAKSVKYALAKIKRGRGK